MPATTKPEKRQLGIIDMKGRTAIHNCTDADPAGVWWGAMAGKDYTVQGNTLVGRIVITEMARAFEETKGSLADRLMAALIAEVAWPRGFAWRRRGSKGTGSSSISTRATTP